MSYILAENQINIIKFYLYHIPNIKKTCENRKMSPKWLQYLFKHIYGGMQKTYINLHERLFHADERRTIMFGKLYGNDVLIKEIKNPRSHYYCDAIICYVLSHLYHMTPNFTNFIGTYYTNNDTLRIISTYEGDTTLYDWLKSDQYNKHDLTAFLIQVIFSIHIAQQKFHFNHLDLHTDNVFVQDKKLEFIYNIDGKYYKLFSNKTMRIIDFDQSRLFYDNNFFGIFICSTKNCLSFNPAFDLFKLIHFILYTLLNVNEERYYDASFLLDMVYPEGSKDVYNILNAKNINEIRSAFKRGRKDYFEHFNISSPSPQVMLNLFTKYLGKSFMEVSQQDYYEQCILFEKENILMKDFVGRLNTNYGYVLKRASSLFKNSTEDISDDEKKIDLNIIQTEYNEELILDATKTKYLTSNEMYSYYKMYILPCMKMRTKLLKHRRMCILSFITDTKYIFYKEYLLNSCDDIINTFGESKNQLLIKVENMMTNEEKNENIYDYVSTLFLTSNHPQQDNYLFQGLRKYIKYYIQRLTTDDYIPPVSNRQLLHLTKKNFEFICKNLCINNLEQTFDKIFYSSIPENCSFKFPTNDLLVMDLSSLYNYDVDLMLNSSMFIGLYFITVDILDAQHKIMRDIVCNVFKALLKNETIFPFIFRQNVVLGDKYNVKKIPLFDHFYLHIIT